MIGNLPANRLYSKITINSVWPIPINMVNYHLLSIHFLSVYVYYENFLKFFKKVPPNVWRKHILCLCITNKLVERYVVVRYFIAFCSCFWNRFNFFANFIIVIVVQRWKTVAREISAFRQVIKHLVPIVLNFDVLFAKKKNFFFRFHLHIELLPDSTWLRWKCFQSLFVFYSFPIIRFVITSEKLWYVVAVSFHCLVKKPLKKFKKIYRYTKYTFVNLSIRRQLVTRQRK